MKNLFFYFIFLVLGCNNKESLNDYDKKILNILQKDSVYVAKITETTFFDHLRSLAADCGGGSFFICEKTIPKIYKEKQIEELVFSLSNDPSNWIFNDIVFFRHFRRLKIEDLSFENQEILHEETEASDDFLMISRNYKIIIWSNNDGLYVLDSAKAYKIEEQARSLLRETLKPYLIFADSLSIKKIRKKETSIRDSLEKMKITI